MSLVFFCLFFSKLCSNFFRNFVSCISVSDPFSSSFLQSCIFSFSFVILLIFHSSRLVCFFILVFLIIRVSFVFSFHFLPSFHCLHVFFLVFFILILPFLQFFVFFCFPLLIFFSRATISNFILGVVPRFGILFGKVIVTIYEIVTIIVCADIVVCLMSSTTHKMAVISCRKKKRCKSNSTIASDLSLNSSQFSTNQ